MYMQLDSRSLLCRPSIITKRLWTVVRRRTDTPKHTGALDGIKANLHDRGETSAPVYRTGFSR